MNIIETIILGIVQGVAEFIPVSSSGHLAIFKNIFGLSDVGLVYDVLLHIGTLLAVVVVFWKDIKKLVSNGVLIVAECFINIGIFFRNLFSKSEKKSYKNILSTSYRRFVLLVIVSSVPTAILGYLMSDMVESVSAGLIVPGIGLLITGVLLLISDMLPDGFKKADNASWWNAIFIGVVQGLATLPGISRSGSTITAALLCKFDRKFAVKYSFIMSIPAILGACLLELKDIGSENLSNTQLIYYLIGMVVAGVVGYVCIKTMLVIVRKKKFKYFAFYCFAVGIFAIVGNFVF